jgi:hypothetical protein
MSSYTYFENETQAVINFMEAKMQADAWHVQLKQDLFVCDGDEYHPFVQRSRAELERWVTTLRELKVHLSTKEFKQCMGL